MLLEKPNAFTFHAFECIIASELLSFTLRAPVRFPLDDAALNACGHARFGHVTGIGFIADGFRRVGRHPGWKARVQKHPGHSRKAWENIGEPED